MNKLKRDIIKKYGTIKEAACFLGVGANSVWHAIKTGEVPINTLREWKRAGIDVSDCVGKGISSYATLPVLPPLMCFLSKSDIDSRASAIYALQSKTTISRTVTSYKLAEYQERHFGK